MRVGTKVAIANLDGFVENPDQGLMVGATGQVVRVGPALVSVKIDVVHVGETEWYGFPWGFRESALEVLDASVS